MFDKRNIDYSMILSLLSKTFLVDFLLIDGLEISAQEKMINIKCFGLVFTYNLNVFLEHEEMLIVLRKEDLPFHILTPLLLAIINITLQELKKYLSK